MLHGAGISTYIFPKNGPNVGQYSIHGASRIYPSSRAALCFSNISLIDLPHPMPLGCCSKLTVCHWTWPISRGFTNHHFCMAVLVYGGYSFSHHGVLGIDLALKKRSFGWLLVATCSDQPVHAHQPIEQNMAPAAFRFWDQESAAWTFAARAFRKCTLPIDRSFWHKLLCRGTVLFSRPWICRHCR